MIGRRKFIGLGTFGLLGGCVPVGVYGPRRDAGEAPSFEDDASAGLSTRYPDAAPRATDAASRDAHSPISDARAPALDAGSSPPDARAPLDAGVSVDAAAPDAAAPDAAAPDARAPIDAGVTDAGCEMFVTMHDTHAQALYFSGKHGPLTGVLTVDDVLAGVAVEIEFWHGHGGAIHRYTVTPTHLARLRAGERVMIETTEVDSHSHMLFIDPTDERYRVAGAPDVPVPNCD